MIPRLLWSRFDVDSGCADAFSPDFTYAIDLLMVTQNLMTALDNFVASLKRDQPDANLPPLLQALWHEAHGDWDRAHKITQKENSADACWVHAYLHRKEGDLGNAGYWYARAKRKASSDSLEGEWRRIVSELLAQDAAI